MRADIAKLLGLNSEIDGPAFQLNAGGGKGLPVIQVEFVNPAPLPPPQRGPSSKDSIDVEPEPLRLGPASQTARIGKGF